MISISFVPLHLIILFAEILGSMYVPLMKWQGVKWQLFSLHFLASDDYVIVSTPPFAESVTEGDVRWDKGK